MNPGKALMHKNNYISSKGYQASHQGLGNISLRRSRSGRRARPLIMEVP
jgi:hypothetical protein